MKVNNKNATANTIGHRSKLPNYLLPKVVHFFNSLSKDEKRSISDCGAALLQASHNLHTSQSELQPSAEVKAALSKLPKEVQQDLIDIDGRIAEITNLLLTCSQPKAMRKDAVNRIQNGHLLGISLKRLPRNLAWKLRLYEHFLTPEQKNSIYLCGKKVINRRSQSQTSRPENPKVEKLLKALSTLGGKDREVLVTYNDRINIMTDVLLQCVKPRVTELQKTTLNDNNNSVPPETMKSAEDLGGDLRGYLIQLPQFLGPKVERFFRSLSKKQQKSLTKCGETVIRAGNLPHVQKGDLMPPKNVFIGLNKIPKFYRQILMDSEGRMQDLINMMLLCGRAKVAAKKNNKTKAGKKHRALLGTWLGKLPKNLAWRFKMFTKQQNNAQRLSLYQCSEELVEAASKQITDSVQTGCQVKQALSKIPKKDRAVVTEYSKVMDQMVDVVLNCLVPS